MNRIERTVQCIRSLPGLRQLDWHRYQRIFANNTTANLFNGVYSSFAEAQIDIPDTKPVGYNHESAAVMYGGIHQRLRLVDYPVLFWLSTLLQDHNSLFDYGGHIGLRYYAFAQHLTFPAGFTWNVWDVPAAVRMGRQLAEENEISGLEFSEDLNNASGSEIFFASGSLQYFEEALPDTLLRLQIRPRRILINGFPLHDQHEFVTINNMTTAFCPYKIFNKQTFLDRMKMDGYRLIDIWQNSAEKRCNIPFHEDYNGATYYGMYYSND